MGGEAFNKNVSTYPKGMALDGAACPPSLVLFANKTVTVIIIKTCLDKF
jgi:hypothetical protein